MVFSGGDYREEAELVMERSKPLHNFRLPCLKWGNQRLLRCIKVNSDGDVVDRSGGGRKRFPVPEYGGSSDRRREVLMKKSSSSSSFWPAAAAADVGISVSVRKMNAAGGGDGEIEATREKLMFDLRKEVGEMKDAILREGLEVEVQKRRPPLPPPPVFVSPAEIDAARPWNLRTRRAACKAPLPPPPPPPVNGGKSLQNVAADEFSRPSSSSPPRNECKSPKQLRTVTGEKRERAKFSVTLSRQELEEDFMAMAGRRLPRKPKKRPKIVQKQIDTLFPGLWLTEITADLYRVPDDHETGKR